MSELAARRLASAIAVSGEVIDPRGLAARAAETRRTYAAVYRSFAAFVGPQATAQDVTLEAVRAYRDHQHAADCRATVPKLSLTGANPLGGKAASGAVAGPMIAV